MNKIEGGGAKVKKDGLKNDKSHRTPLDDPTY